MVYKFSLAASLMVLDFIRSFPAKNFVYCRYRIWYTVPYRREYRPVGVLLGIQISAGILCRILNSIR